MVNWYTPDIAMVITIDDAKIRQLEWAFRSWPKAITRILKESINQTANQCRTRFVRTVREIVELKAWTIRRSITVKGATNETLSATVSLSGRLHAGEESIARGTIEERIITASPAQSTWLYFNVFKKKYGDAAIFSWAYHVRRKIESGVGWILAGTRWWAPTDAFVAQGRGRLCVFRVRSSMQSGFKTGGQNLELLHGPAIGQVIESATGLMNTIKAETFAGLEKNIDKRVGRFLIMMKKRDAA